MKSTTLSMLSMGVSGWVLDRQVQAIAPFFPRTDVVAHTRITEQPQSQIGVGGSIAALAVRHHFLVRRDAEPLVHLPQLGGCFEFAVLVQIFRPLEVHGSWNRAASRGTYLSSAVLSVAARV